MYCKKCGMKLLDGDPFCSACGEATGGTISDTLSKTEEPSPDTKHGKKGSVLGLIGESLSLAFIITFFFDLQIYVGIIIFIVSLAAELIYKVVKEQ